jgi:hypothetical protein
MPPLSIRAEKKPQEALFVLPAADGLSPLLLFPDSKKDSTWGELSFSEKVFLLMGV